MDTFYQDDYLIDSRDIDLFGHCRPSAVLGLLQEAATEAACAAPSRTGTQVSWGPHVKQASGWAWKRRSAGSSYSLRQRSHMMKGAMEVLARS